jgi:hypothetical protein
MKHSQIFVLAGLFLPFALSCSTTSPNSSGVSSTSSSSPATPISSSSSSSSSEVTKNKKVTSLTVDGVNDEALVESLCYQQPVWGHEILERYPGHATDAFKPTLSYDDQGGLSFSMDVPYTLPTSGVSYRWHVNNAYSSIGNTTVPSSYLDNILFDDPVTSSSSAIVLDTVTTGINWNANHTINSSGSLVEAGVSVDMSTQIDSITLSNGTVVTDWTLAANNTAYASANGKSFTILNAGKGIQINLMNGTVKTGFYFKVDAYSAALGNMFRNIEAKPFACNYTAELIRSSDQSVLARGIHNENYFYKENSLTSEKRGKLLLGENKQSIGYDFSSGEVVLDEYRSYPFSEYFMGSPCPIDNPREVLIDTLKNAASAAGPVIVKPTLATFIANFVLSTVGYSANAFGVNANIIAVSYDTEKDAFVFALYNHIVDPDSYNDTGLKVVLSSRGNSKIEAVDSFLATAKAPLFKTVPSDMITSWKRLEETKNYTLSSVSFWLDAQGTPLTDNTTIKALEFASGLYQTASTSYTNDNAYFAEDKARKNYLGCLGVNGRLYEITGNPDYQHGSIYWVKKDISEYTLPSSTEKQASDNLWLNPNAASLYSTAYLTKANLANLNIHSLAQSEVAGV